MPAEPRGAAGQEPDEPESRERRRNVGLGRKLVLTVWAVGIVYITLVAFMSVIPQALFPERGLAADTVSPRGCDESLRTLYAQLMAHAAAQTQNPAEDASEDATFFRDWDRRHTALTGQCDESLHANLGRLRHRIQTSLRRYEREEGRLARSLAQRLADPDAHPARNPEESHP